MHISTVTAAALLAVAALTPAEASQTDARPYKGHGTEPFWSVEIGSGTMRFEAPGRRPVTAPKPRPIVGFNGEIYQTRRMTVDITHVECNDGMSDRTYHDTVTVKVDGRSYKGCGGEILEPVRAPLQGEWRIDSIGGKPVVRGSNPTITFGDGRISGNTGCNSFNGSYRVVRGAIVAGPMATTRRACFRSVGTQERDLIDLLGKRLTIGENRRGRVTLTAPGGRTLVIERERRR